MDASLSKDRVFLEALSILLTWPYVRLRLFSDLAFPLFAPGAEPLKAEEKEALGQAIQSHFTSLSVPVAQLEAEAAWAKLRDRVPFLVCASFAPSRADDLCCRKNSMHIT